MATEQSSVFDSAFRERLRRLRVAVRAGGLAHVQGERQSKTPGFGLEFEGHRHYTPGDDLRLLDWNAFGRLDQLVLKQFQAPGRLPVVLAPDLAPSMSFGEPAKLPYAAQLAAALGVVGLEARDRLVALPLRTQAKAAAAIDGEDELYTLINGLRIDTNGPDHSAWLKLLRAIQGDKLVFLLTDALRRKALLSTIKRAQAQGAKVVVLNLAAPQELNPSFRGNVRMTFSDEQDTRPLKLSINDDALEAYREEVKRYRSAVANACRKISIACLNIETTTPIESVIAAMISARILKGTSA